MTSPTPAIMPSAGNDCQIGFFDFDEFAGCGGSKESMRRRLIPRTSKIRSRLQRRKISLHFAAWRLHRRRAALRTLTLRCSEISFPIIALERNSTGEKSMTSFVQ